MLPLLPLLGAGSSLLGGLFGHKAKQKQAAEQRRAQIAQGELANNMSEDKRLARLNLGSSILGNLKPGAAYGGHVNFNTAIDPALLAQLQQRRKYDFASATPDANVGSGSDFLGGLFGGLGGLLGETDLMRQKRMGR